MANKYYKVTLGWSVSGLGREYNTFAFREMRPTTDTDANILTDLTAYLTSVYQTSGLRNVMHTSRVFYSGVCWECSASGGTIRQVGTLGSANLSGQSSGDAEPGPVALSVTARTNTPDVRGGKRFPGVVDGGIVGGLLTNGVMSILVAAATRYITPYTVLGVVWYQPGVFSSKTGAFVPFNNQALVTNIPGTQVTRKPLRGN